MRNALPASVPRDSRYRESGIVNLDDKDGPGMHWVANVKTMYFTLIVSEIFNDLLI